jgi:hypothetical protein
MSIIYLSPAVSQAVLSQQLPQREQGSVMSVDTSTAVRNSNGNSAMPSWDNAPVQPFSASHVHGQLFIIVASSMKRLITCGANYNFSHIGGPGAVATNNCSSSIESPSGTWPTSEAVEQENVVPPLRGEHSLLQYTLCKSTLAMVLLMT